jgi:hypothetical protein
MGSDFAGREKRAVPSITTLKSEYLSGEEGGLAPAHRFAN